MHSVTCAVFDLDGTITCRDTFLQYLLDYLKAHPWRVFNCVRAIPTVLFYLVGLADRSALKASIIQATLGGSTREQIESWTERWVPLLLEHGVFRDALARIAEHRAAGDILVLMSASPDVYVPSIARHLEFAEVTCTGILWDGALLNGALTTPNCRGEEKARRFGILRSRHPGACFVAYGNAASDLAHLSLADRGVLINGDRLARRQAERLHIVCERWS